MNWNDPIVKSDGFSLKRYAMCLQKMKDLDYKTIQVRDSMNSLPDRFIILRHDIEYSIDCVFAMAELEHQYGIHSSYFVLLHSLFYNPFTPDNTEKLLRIVEMGHEIGLHYETYYYEGLGKDVVKGIRDDCEYLGRTLGIETRSISQHRPARSSVVQALNEYFIDAYNPKLIYGMYYISDSGCKWRDLDLYNSLGTMEGIHALIHPDYWGFDETMNLPDIYQAISYRNAQYIIDEGNLLIQQNHEYLLYRAKMDEERKKKYAGQYGG